MLARNLPISPHKISKKLLNLRLRIPTEESSATFARDIFENICISHYHQSRHQEKSYQSTMRLAIAAALLAQTLHLSSAQSEKHAAGRKDRLMEDLLSGRVDATTTKSVQAITSNKSGRNLLRNHFRRRRTRVLKNMVSLGPVVECDPTKDEDGNLLGILSCGADEYCGESKNSSLGGICYKPINVSRKLQTSAPTSAPTVSNAPSVSPTLSNAPSVSSAPTEAPLSCVDFPKQDIIDANQNVTDCCYCPGPAQEGYAEATCDAESGVSDTDCFDYCYAYDCCNCNDWDDTTGNGEFGCENYKCYEDCSEDEYCVRSTTEYFIEGGDVAYGYCADVSSDTAQFTFCYEMSAENPFLFTINDVPCDVMIDYQNFDSGFYYDCSNTVLSKINGGKTDDLNDLFEPYLDINQDCDDDESSAPSVSAAPSEEDANPNRNLGSKSGKKDSKKTNLHSKKTAKKSSKSSKKSSKKMKTVAPTSDSVCLAEPTAAPTFSYKHGKKSKKGGKKQGKKGKKDAYFGRGGYLRRE